METTPPPLVHDLPNEIREFEWRKEAFYWENVYAIENYQENSLVDNVYISTPWLENNLPEHIDYLIDAIEQDGGIVISSGKTYPDIKILQLADQLEGYPVSKDKYKEFYYESKNRRLEFEISGGQMIIKNAEKFGLGEWL